MHVALIAAKRRYNACFADHCRGKIRHGLFFLAVGQARRKTRALTCESEQKKKTQARTMAN